MDARWIAIASGGIAQRNRVTPKGEVAQVPICPDPRPPVSVCGLGDNQISAAATLRAAINKIAPNVRRRWAFIDSLLPLVRRSLSQRSTWVKKKINPIEERANRERYVTAERPEQRHMSSFAHSAFA
jgi:hypothetical protein